MVGGVALAGLARSVPARYRLPLGCAAVIAPLATPIVATACAPDLRREYERKREEKVTTAERIVNNNPKIFPSTRLYENLVAARADKLSSKYHAAVGHLDADSNKRIEKDELNLAMASNTGDRNLNLFLIRHYDDLERISQTIGKPHEPGITSQAIRLLADQTKRSDVRRIDNRAVDELVGRSEFSGSLAGGAIGFGVGVGLAIGTSIALRRPGLIHPGIPSATAITGAIPGGYIMGGREQSRLDLQLVEKEAALKRLQRAL